MKYLFGFLFCAIGELVLFIIGAFFFLWTCILMLWHFRWSWSPMENYCDFRYFFEPNWKWYKSEKKTTAPTSSSAAEIIMENISRKTKEQEYEGNKDGYRYARDNGKWDPDYILASALNGVQRYGKISISPIPEGHVMNHWHPAYYDGFKEGLQVGALELQKEFEANLPAFFAKSSLHQGDCPP